MGCPATRYSIVLGTFIGGLPDACLKKTPFTSLACARDMELKWLEDFLSLADTRSFSKSAEERHATQSTLSRRIKLLEEWLGLAVIDRSSFPVSLTRAGEQFHKDVVDIVRSTYRARAAARARGLHSVAPLRIGAQHVIARYFLPDLLRQIEPRVEIGGAQLKSDNLAQIVDDLVDGHIDFLVCYHHSSLPAPLEWQRFPSLQISSEPVIPVSAPDEKGAPLFSLPGTRERPVPYVGFSPDVPVGWHRQAGTVSPDLEVHLDPLYESTMGEIVRELVLDGRGLGWLQMTLIEQDLEQGRLVQAGGSNWVYTNEIRIFRALGPGRNHLEQVWNVLCDLAKQRSGDS